MEIAGARAEEARLAMRFCEKGSGGEGALLRGLLLLVATATLPALI